MNNQSKKLGLGVLFTILLITQIKANDFKIITNSSILEEKTYTRTISDFEMLYFPDGEKNALLNVAKEATITITCAEDKTISLIELEVDFSDEIGKTLVNKHGLFKDDVTIPDDFRGTISWTLHASEELKKSLNTAFQESEEVDPIDIFLKKKDYFSPNSSINFDNYEMYMSFRLALYVESNACSYKKFIVIQPTADNKYIEILLHKVKIFIEYNEENEVTEMYVKGLISTEEFQEEYKDISVFNTIALTEENIGTNKFIAIELQAQQRLLDFMGEQITAEPDTKSDDIFTDGQYTHVFRTVEYYDLANHNIQEYNPDAPETQSFVQEMPIQELILDTENPSTTYAVPMSRIFFELINTRTDIVGLTFEGTVTLPIAKFLKENSPVFENIELPEEPFGQLPLVRFKLQMNDEMSESFNQEHKKLKPEYRALGVYINSPRSEEFRNIKHYKLVDMKFENEPVDNFIPILEIKKID